MAKLSSINKNNRRKKMSDRFYAKRKKLKLIIMNKNLPLEERFCLLYTSPSPRDPE